MNENFYGTQLALLDISYNRIQEKGAADISGSLHLNQCLTALNLDNNQLGDEGGALMANVLCDPDYEAFLEHMVISQGYRDGEGDGTVDQTLSTNMSDAESFMRDHGRNKGLTSLSMQYCGLTEAAGAILAGGVLRLPSLASLELRGNDLGSGGVVEVLRALVPLHAGGQPHPAMAHLGVADTGCAIEGELHEALTACFDENPLCGSFDMRGAPLGDTTAYELITLFKKVHTHVQAFEVSATSGWGPLDPQLYKQIYAVTAANQKGKKGGKKGKKGGKKKK